MSSQKYTTQVYSSTGEKVKDVKLNPDIFGVTVKESVVHQVAMAQMANVRKNIAHTKDRSEVRGGGAKPWRQKGTGRARHGSRRSPIWVGGGVTFGPRKEQNFSKKVNKKMKRKALLMCLSDKVNNDLLFLLDKLSLEEGKTREMVDVVKNMKKVLKLKRKVKKEKSEKGKKENKEDKPKSKKFDIKKYKLSLLIVLPKSDRKVFQAGRNLAGVKIITAESLNVVDLLKYEKVILLAGGLKIIEDTYLKN